MRSVRTEEVFNRGDGETGWMTNKRHFTMRNVHLFGQMCWKTPKSNDGDDMQLIQVPTTLLYHNLISACIIAYYHRCPT